MFFSQGQQPEVTQRCMIQGIVKKMVQSSLRSTNTYQGRDAESIVARFTLQISTATQRNWELMMSSSAAQQIAMRSCRVALLLMYPIPHLNVLLISGPMQSIWHGRHLFGVHNVKYTTKARYVTALNGLPGRSSF